MEDPPVGVVLNCRNITFFCPCRDGRRPSRRWEYTETGVELTARTFICVSNRNTEPGGFYPPCLPYPSLPSSISAASAISSSSKHVHTHTPLRRTGTQACQRRTVRRNTLKRTPRAMLIHRGSPQDLSPKTVEEIEVFGNNRLGCRRSSHSTANGMKRKLVGQLAKHS